MMTAVELIDSYVADWNAHDVERVVGWFTDDALYEDTSLNIINRGHDDLRRFLSTFFHSYPNVAFTVVGVYDAGSVITWEWEMKGNYENEGEAGQPGPPPAGQAISVRGTSITELAEGKVTANRDYWNLAALLAQLGVLPQIVS